MLRAMFRAILIGESSILAGVAVAAPAKIIQPAENGTSSMGRQFRIAVTFIMLAFSSHAALAAKWQYEITPYLWAAGMEGDIGTPGRTTSVDVSFSDYVSAIDSAFAFIFEGRSDKWSYFVDLMWVKLQEDLNLPATTIDAEVEQLLLEGFVGYRPDAWRDVRVYGGLRYTDVDSTFDFVGLPPNFSVGDSFTDPFVGLEWRRRYEKWEFLLAGDIGGGIDADFAWSANFGASYFFSDRWSVKFAYRVLDIDYESDEFVFDMRLDGALLGVGFKF